ncbi:tetratricopeptide repeat protein [Sphingomonas sp.]|uniref:tetratricopeptide repeat protein n=1 Tax=Sphingomonas sp. TaxID=28214 RepID=UPI002DEFE417|nr:tetratricopeptide repeat protein [Sphingomonas sp.]
MASKRLDGWKAIAVFLNRDERTVRRWEATRGLPIHRIPGGERPRIWADPDELRQWLQGAGAVDEDVGPDPATAPSSPSKRRSMREIAGAAALILGVPLAGTLYVVAKADRAEAEPYAEHPAARELYLRGVFLWNGRTPRGIAEAAAIFARLAREHPGRSEALAKLADCYLLMREFGTMPDDVAYARAREAAEAALRIDRRSASGLRALAFVRFWHDGDPEALETFARAAELKPDNAQTQLWYANALSASGRHVEAQAAFTRARALDPSNAAVLADQAFDLLFAGRVAEADRLANMVLDVQPGLVSAHRVLAWVALRRGDHQGFINELSEWVRLRGDEAALARYGRARRLLAEKGSVAMLSALAEDAEAGQRSSGSGFIEAAMLRAASGDRSGAARLLDAAESTSERVSVPVARRYTDVR